jgi:hypothetical protein
MDTRERATMGKGMPNMEAPMDPFGRIMDLECLIFWKSKT